MSKKEFIIVTLFPNAFEDFVNTSIIKKAIESGNVNIKTLDIRNYANNKHNHVDDYPYGGGAGMVLKALPVIDAINAAKKMIANAKVILLSPQGKKWQQDLAYQYSSDNNNYILVCGHYEGIDERIMKFIDQEISIGDFVLTGGELPAMVVVDSITRLLDNVITSESHLNESFNNDLLDYPTYTRPEVVLGMKVPDVLLSGHHQNIETYRKEQALINTYNKRPDLYKKLKLSDKEKKMIEKYQKQKNNK